MTFVSLPSRRRHTARAVGVAMLLFLVGCRGPGSTLLTDVERARALTAELSLELDQIDRCSSRAVMSDSTAASAPLAEDTRRAIATVNRDLAELGPLLERLRSSPELAGLREFRARWSEYQPRVEQLLVLAQSRRDTNARALALASREQARLAISCEQALPPLQRGLARRAFKATR